MTNLQWYEARDAKYRAGKNQAIYKQIDSEMAAISRNSQEYRRLQYEIQQAERELGDKIQHNEDFIDFNAKKVLEYVVYAFLPCGGYFLNLLLVYRPSEYLVTNSLGEGPISSILIFFVPLLLILIELTVAFCVYQAADPSISRGEIIAHVFEWVTPMMFIATHVTVWELEQELPKLNDLILIGAQFFLAWVVDAMIVRYHREILGSYTFFAFIIDINYLRNQISSLASASRRAYLAAGNATDRYHDLIQRYNDANPDSPYRRPPCDRHTEGFIAEWSHLDGDPPLRDGVV